MGVVYEAFQEGINRKVALKILPANITLDKKSVQRFHREAESVGKLQHGNVIQIFDNGQIGNTHYIAMELVEGTGFDALRCVDRMSIRQAVAMARDAARGLAHAHAQGVIHRDIKPSNLLVDREGRVVVSDFGLARVKDSASLTSTDAIVGTPKYMAPEQILPGARPLDGRADIYSLGATLYHAVAGRPPIEAPSVQAFFKSILEDRPHTPRRFNKLCPHDLATIILRCLEKNPDQRYPDADALADDLDRFLTGERIHARPKGAVARAVGWVHRHKVITSLAAVALIGAVTTLMLGGRVAEESARSKLLTRINDVRSLSVSDLEVAVVDAETLAEEYPAHPEVDKLLDTLYARRARAYLEDPQIAWSRVVQDLERAEEKDDLWYLMCLVQMGRFDEAADAADDLPEGAEQRVLTFARLALVKGEFTDAISNLARLPGDPHPFTLLVLARAHHALSVKQEDEALAKQHLDKASEYLYRARAKVRLRWLRTQIQLELFEVGSRQGKSLNLRESVDDLGTVANEWWDGVAGVWEGMTRSDVGRVKDFIQRILALANMPQALAAEIEFRAQERLKQTGARDQVVGYLLLAVAHLSKKNVQLARRDLEKADELVSEDDDLLPLTPYIDWGRSILFRAEGKLDRAVDNANIALMNGVTYEGEFGDLEPIANYTVLLAEDARKDGNEGQEREAKLALERNLRALKSRPIWVTDLLARIAAKASSQDPPR
jgi:hypothetical protein